jgi:hypothetical protein
VSRTCRMYREVTDVRADVSGGILCISSLRVVLCVLRAEELLWFSWSKNFMNSRPVINTVPRHLPF